MKHSTEATIIFPHQLFERHEALDKKRVVYLIEAPRYFIDFKFHKKKITFHRASMQAYKDYLTKKKFKVAYIPFNQYQKFFTLLNDLPIEKIHYIDPVDIPFEKEFLKILPKKIAHQKHATTSFLTPDDWLEKQLKNKKNFLMHSFYIKQRKRMNILLTKDKKPVGGKWSFDKENRETLDDEIKIPKIWKPKATKYVKKATQYVDDHFAKNPGSTKNFFYPVTFSDAQKWFNDFLKKRFNNFGPYEDAIAKDELILFHSVLSPLLNSGLLLPENIVKKTLDYADKNDIPINSLEGFIRQIIGWREFVRGVYLFAEKRQRKSNFFEHKKKLPKSFWKASIDIKPIDITIQKVLEHAYVHHIERLMVLGNFMLLCQFDPDDIYTWFMELFIDAYDWVMVPNVYSMSQYADGGLMTTKPYISSSNYVLKMSDYKSNKWTDIWDALYWHFLEKHKNKLSKNPRTKIMYYHLNKMSAKKKKQYLNTAAKFLKKM
ncbi:MAG: cryptochrome/photolyase family protein [Candidatus Babeliales bacterium]